MKIAFIYDAVYPFVTGGAEKRVYELAKRLAQKGHEVHWYGIGWWWPEEEDIELDGIKLHGVCKPMNLYNEGRRSIKEALLFSLKLFLKLMDERYDIVDCQGFPFFSCFTAKIHAILGKSKLVITLHEVWNDYWYEYLGKAGFFGKLVEKIMVHLSDDIISVSKKTREDLKGIKKSGKSAVIPNGIDFQEIADIKPGTEKFDVIYAGRLIKDKNVDLLIKTIGILKEKKPDIKCLIIGEGPEKKEMINLTANLEIQKNVIFKGFLKNHTDLFKYMKSSRVFVLPSKREGFGMVVIEANACGLPVVVVNHKMNAATDLIIPELNGFIAEPSKKDIAEKIMESVKNKDKMESKCIEISRKYDWNKIVDSLLKFYMDISELK
ncbi:MAG: glycosyltransferase family 4 protein [Methanobacteriaceae archaeon]|jgi:glycosyltransferase involved in cell wall biosynthesis